MLAIATAVKLRSRIANSTALGVSRVGKVAYQTHSTQGRNVKSKWFSRLLAYFQSGLNALKNTTTASSNSAAGRLQAAMPRGPNWLRSIAARASAAVRQPYAIRGGFVSQRLKGLLSNRPISFGYRGRLAFEKGGKWSPFMNMLASNMRTLSAGGGTPSAQIIMAQLHRQSLGCMAEQRRGLAIALPRSQKACARMLESSPQQPAATRMASEHADTRNTCSNSAEDSVSCIQGNVQMHPTAMAAQEAAVPFEQCVTIIIPYMLPKSVNSLALADMASHLAKMSRMQHQHDLFLARLFERLSQTGWQVQYREVMRQSECIEVAIPPSSGIVLAKDMDAILCEWGFDTSLMAVEINDPLVATASKGIAAPHSNPASSQALGSSLSLSLLEDSNSELFSLIVDDVVDPEEAYRQQVHDFLADLESMPRVSKSFALLESANSPTIFL
ncbi:hypothetical protein LPJ78_004149 [Coemansia sp. RSA 989]|nr:hypothetical protein BX667DRAFT_329557 [Coemansia mojavensis]KAJ1863281.1 hypothetical protein LPJ78_004149 [Coemansia sp. RSA 989]